MKNCGDWVDVPYWFALLAWLWLSLSIATVFLGLFATYWTTWVVGYICAVIVAVWFCYLSRQLRDRNCP